MNLTDPAKNVFKLQEAVQQSLHSFEKEADSIQLQFVTDLVAPLTLVGDEQVLQTVICILTKAAARFVGATKVVISMKRLLQAGDEVLVEFEVSDNGPGISSEDKSSLFSYKRSLAEARIQVKQQGGRSVINSLYGVGTNFKFLLQYKVVQNEEHATVSTTSQNGLAGKRVLVAEDNELNQLTIAHLLKREGIHVDIAGDGREAIEMFENNRGYDLMLLDLHLPHMDGFQSAVYIRKKLKSNIPIIALTAGFYTNAKARCSEIGIDHYITKPLQPAELLKNLNYFLVK
ncbi:response regulator [Chitinophagaceae bacterium LB-8]|uniref:Response regulator n=1 Tax=Paraflavisolibacter caeni TaxID=2982496 RepID=A0A9X2XYM8_9BACT|nr:response regulator [Paraflavisolibacter caeni]MCU7551625.1 response regulator [Paraflavisolibacter caeni]